MQHVQLGHICLQGKKVLCKFACWGPTLSNCCSCALLALPTLRTLRANLGSADDAARLQAEMSAVGPWAPSLEHAALEVEGD